MESEGGEEDRSGGGKSISWKSSSFLLSPCFFVGVGEVSFPLFFCCFGTLESTTQDTALIRSFIGLWHSIPSLIFHHLLSSNISTYRTLRRIFFISKRDHTQ